MFGQRNLNPDSLPSGHDQVYKAAVHAMCSTSNHQGNDGHAKHCTQIDKSNLLMNVQVPFWCQKCSQHPDGFVVWDYHVSSYAISFAFDHLSMLD